MYVRSLKISNFRGIRDTRLRFEPGLNILIGPNNIGKSTVLRAIDMVLNPSVQWWRPDCLNALDFWHQDIETDMAIELVLGCGQESCEKCSLLDGKTKDGLESCRFAEFAVVVDRDELEESFVTIDRVSNVESPEIAIRLAMYAHYIDGDVEVSHYILNELGETWAPLTRKMKQALGCSYLSSMRDPTGNLRLQMTSLLTHALGNIDTQRRQLKKHFVNSTSSILDEWTKDVATPVFKSLKKALQQTHFDLDYEMALGLGEVQLNDILRQIQLCHIQESEIGRSVLPFACHGRGVQNIVTTVLGLLSRPDVSSNNSILLLEEVEQNLEPQLQRSIIRVIQNLTHKGAQYIVTTHSPYVLAPLLDLEGVQKLSMNRTSGMLVSCLLKSVQISRGGFSEVRRCCPYDTELLEALFSRLVVIWEGECEAGFYPTLFREQNVNSAEWLSGLCADGSSMTKVAEWFKNAGYDVVVILDGDKPGDLGKLADIDVAFIALPCGMAMETVIEKALNNMDSKTAIEVLLQGIGACGYVNLDKLGKNWSELKGVFAVENPYSSVVETDVVLKRCQNGEITVLPSDVTNVLKKHKERRVYRALAGELIGVGRVPPILQSVLGHLYKMWTGSVGLGEYQLDEAGVIHRWKRTTV